MAFQYRPAFFFSVYEDYELCRRLVRQIRRYYPSATAIAVSDGPITDPDWEDFCCQNRVQHFVTPDRQKIQEYGGRWLHRLLFIALRASTESWLIKLEGDSMLHRPFRNYGKGQINASLSKRGFPRGGCISFRRSAVIQLVDSGFLLDSRYRQAEFLYHRYGKWKHPYEKSDDRPVVCADSVLGDAIARLELDLQQWDEVNILFRGDPEIGDYAATHPHPLPPASGTATIRDDFDTHGSA